jgi:hypothetical protein
MCQEARTLLHKRGDTGKEAKGAEEGEHRDYEKGDLPQRFKA